MRPSAMAGSTGSGHPAPTAAQVLGRRHPSSSNPRRYATSFSKEARWLSVPIATRLVHSKNLGNARLSRLGGGPSCCIAREAYLRLPGTTVNDVTAAVIFDLR